MLFHTYFLRKYWDFDLNSSLDSRPETVKMPVRSSASSSYSVDSQSKFCEVHLSFHDGASFRENKRLAYRSQLEMITLDWPTRRLIPH